jgi:hypothetical protein
VVHRFPVRQVVREQMPRAAAAHPIENPVQDLPLAIQPRATAGFRRRQEWFQLCPLGVG